MAGGSDAVPESCPTSGRGCSCSTAARTSRNTREVCIASPTFCRYLRRNARNPSSRDWVVCNSPDRNPYGNEQRDRPVGPMYANTNISLFELFLPRERVSFQLRAEALNALARSTLVLPAPVVGNSAHWPQVRSDHGHCRQRGLADLPSAGRVPSENELVISVR